MNKFALAYREQQQLFIYEKTYFTGTLLKVGGLSTLMARFAVQFFWSPLIAMGITVMLLALSAYLLWASIRRDRRDWLSLLTGMIPACLIGASLSDNSLHFDYLTSVILVEAALVIYNKIIRTKRILWGILMTIILYITAGPAAICFAVSAAVIELSKGSRLRWFSAAYPITALACGYVSYLTAGSATLACALTPAFHYNLDESAPLLHWLGWLAIPVATAAAQIRNKRLFAPVTLILFAGAMTFSVIVSQKSDKNPSITSYEYEYYTVNERWDELAESCRHQVWSPGTANYLNLAYAYKGTLTDNLFKYDNRGVSSLFFMPEEKSVDVRVAHIMYAMGNMAAAQNVSFNAMRSTEGFCPAMLKMNAKVELMRGTYDVADKYLSILEKSLHYRKWARKYRQFLWNDQAVDNDRELSTGRKDMEVSDGFAMLGNPIDELMKVIDANPDDKKAMDYALSFLLLSKDIARLKDFTDRYWGSGALNVLPEYAQEALIFYSEYSRNFENVEPVSLEWCLAHGVAQNTIHRFEAFQKASLKSRGAAPSGYKETYWNYLLYTQL